MIEVVAHDRDGRISGKARARPFEHRWREINRYGFDRGRPGSLDEREQSPVVPRSRIRRGFAGTNSRSVVSPSLRWRIESARPRYSLAWPAEVQRLTGAFRGTVCP